MRSRNRLSEPQTSLAIRRTSECILNPLICVTPPIVQSSNRSDPFKNLQRVGTQTPKLKPVCPARRNLKKSSTDRLLDMHSPPAFIDNTIEPPNISKPICFSAYASPRQLRRRSKIIRDFPSLQSSMKETDRNTLRIRKIPSVGIKEVTRRSEHKIKDRLTLDCNRLNLDRITTPKFHSDMKPDYLSIESYSCSSESTCLPNTNRSTPASSSKGNSPRDFKNKRLLNNLGLDIREGSGASPQDMSFGDIYPPY